METKTIYISEKQYKEVYETILQESLVVNNNLVKDVAKYLDKYFKAIKYDDVNENGDVVAPYAIQVLSKSGEPLQTISVERLIDKIDGRYCNKIKDDNDRHKFFKQLVKDWLNGKIGPEGMLSVNTISEAKLISPEEAEKGGFAIDQSDMNYTDGEFMIPKNVGKGYKVFALRNGKLYPPVIANDGAKETPIGEWLPSSSPVIVGYTADMHRPHVASGTAGTSGRCKGTMAFRPGWHLGEIPYAKQFMYKTKNGKQLMYQGRPIWPSDLVWAECLYSNDVDYQEEAESYGYTKSGKFSNALAGLPKIPKNGSYRYRTNPDPDTVPWIISGAMKVDRLLSFDEVDDILRKAGITPPIVMSKKETQMIR